jgi:NAD+ diphosphatase
VAGERARRCPRCGLTSFPRLSPVVIVLIERADTGQVLMARGRNFPEGFFGIIAGFVEPGESLEEAVRREVREEVGLELDEPRYFGSQPWPFPHALMVGFEAVYAGGELRLDERELAEAGWYSPDDPPRIPPRLSIARRLIDAWAARHGRTLAVP